MLEVKDYPIPDDVKRILGTMIKEIRIQKNNQFKKEHQHTIITYNPYIKTNFTDQNLICHVNTLKKLETDLIKEDTIYHQLLHKLDLYYQIEPEDHIQIMAYLNQVLINLLQAREYLNDEMVQEIKKVLLAQDYQDDCIAIYYRELLLLSIYLYEYGEITKSDIEKFESLGDIYEGLFRPFFYHTVGVYYSRNHDQKKSLNYYLIAKQIYEANQISLGLINSNLIALHIKNYNYVDAIKLCIEMEQYFNSTNNYRHLIKIYGYFFDFYLLMNNERLAMFYYQKALELNSKYTSLERYLYFFYYNLALYYFSEMNDSEFLKYAKQAYQQCVMSAHKLDSSVLYLLALSKSNRSNPEILGILNQSKVFIKTNPNQDSLMLYKYFQFKYESPNYFRRYTHERLIPYLENKPHLKDYLMFIYEDFYKNL
jgi:hypothetical protein